MTSKATGPSDGFTFVEIRVRCLTVSADHFNVIGEARFTTFHTANAG